MRNFYSFIFGFVLILVSCSPGPGGVTSTLVDSPTSRPSDTVASPPCFLLHYPVTPESAMGAQFENRGHIIGPADAPVTIIAFSDYQCLPCAFLAASLRQVRLAHANDVRLIYLHAPQNDRDKDILAIQAVEAADLQGEFWTMHDLLFEKQAEWSALAPADFESWAASQATGLGMNSVRFQSDFNGPEVADRLKLSTKSIAGVQPFSPPLLFINSSKPYTSLADFASLDMVVRLDALTARQFSACPAGSVDPLKQVIVSFQLDKGYVVLQLFPEKAPQAVNNFIFLARSGWYDNITFYRVLPGLRVMSGDPSGTGLGNPGYLFTTEIPAGSHFDKPGMLAMDNDGPDTNGSRFFITLAPAPQLDDQYTIFGQVLSGLEILSSLTPRNPQPGVYLPPGDVLIKVTLEER